jgi:guanylate kinase
MLFVISGPSGCGKSTLIRKVRRALGDLGFSVSHTTRPPRPSEKDGVDYHFVTEAAFARMVREGRFLEHARVHGHRYGTSLAEVGRKSRGRDLVLDIDVQGARQVRRRVPGAVLVFIMPPVAAELRRRLEKRREDSPREVERRLRNARAEVRAYGEFDFVVVNDDLARAAGELKCVIMAARRRPSAMGGALRPILKSFPKGRP